MICVVDSLFSSCAWSSMLVTHLHLLVTRCTYLLLGNEKINHKIIHKSFITKLEDHSVPSIDPLHSSWS